MWKRLKGFLAAALLPTQPTPKAPKPGGLAYPGYRRSIKTSGSQIPTKPFQVVNVDLASAYRTSATTAETVRNFTRFSPELAASVAITNRVGIPEKYIAIARDPDGSMNVEATRLALQLLRQMNTMPDYMNGFSHVGSLRSVSEALGKQAQQEGAMMMELVLDKSRLPSQFAPIPVSQVVFFEDEKGLKPKQKVGGELIDLDVPTVFYVALDPDLYDAYPQSPLESVLQPVLASTSFLNDMRRVCNRHAYQRYDIIIDEEKLRARIPLDIQQDADKLQAYLNARLDEIETTINNAGPEEALVHYDYFTVEYVKGDSGTLPDTFDTVGNIYSSKIATGSKTPPSILGMGAKSATAASTETLTFMLHANAMIRVKLQELYSKALTMAVRLMGMDVTVEFEFDDIELRPKSELEAYLAMKQSRILTQLSFGLISDEEACLRLTGQLPPKTFRPLSGTLFPITPTTQVVENGNNVSTTGNMNKAPEQTRGKAK